MMRRRPIAQRPAVRLPVCHIVGLLLIATTLAWPLAAAADEPPTEGSNDPSWLYRHGVELADKGALLEAIAAFERAYALRPHARVLYNLGQAFIRLGRHSDAHRHLSRYLSEAGASLAADRKADVQAQIDELRSVTAAVQVKVEPAGADVFVDNEPAGQSPLAEPVRVDPGRHHILAQKDGFGPSSAFINVGAGDAERVHLMLVPLPKPPPAVAPDLSAAKPRSDEAISVRAALPPAVPILNHTLTAVTTSLLVAGGAMAVTAGGLALWNAQRRAEWQRNDAIVLGQPQQGLDEAQRENLLRENNALRRSINRMDGWALAAAIGSGVGLLGAGSVHLYNIAVMPAPSPRIALHFVW